MDEEEEQQHIQQHPTSSWLRLSALCQEYGLRVCVSTDAVTSDDNLFMGLRTPSPCVKVSCAELERLQGEEQLLRQRTTTTDGIYWRGVSPNDKHLQVVSATLTLSSSPSVVLATSHPTTVLASVTSLAPSLVEIFERKSEKNEKEKLVTTATISSMFQGMQLKIEFPPPNVQIWSDDLRVSTIVEVEDSQEFAKRHDDMRACFSLEKVEKVETVTNVETPTTTEAKKLLRVEFCDDLDVSVLRFKGLNNGTYLLTLWMEEKEEKRRRNQKKKKEVKKLRSANATRRFQIMRGSPIVNGWLVDPRLRLMRPSHDPTTPSKYIGWPCCGGGSSSSSAGRRPQKGEEGEGLELERRRRAKPMSTLDHQPTRTSMSARPWFGEHQLSIPIISSTSSSSSPSSSFSRRQAADRSLFKSETSRQKTVTRVWPTTSYAWEHERRSNNEEVTLVIGIKVEATGFEYRRVARATWILNHEDDVKIWFIIGIPSTQHDNATLDKILTEAKMHGDMLLGDHPRYAGDDYPVRKEMFFYFNFVLLFLFLCSFYSFCSFCSFSAFSHIRFIYFSLSSLSSLSLSSLLSGSYFTSMTHTTH